MWKGNDYYSLTGTMIGRVWKSGAYWYWGSGPYQGQHATEAEARAGLERFADS